jgi:hypothetical protein
MKFRPLCIFQVFLIVTLSIVTPLFSSAYWISYQLDHDYNLEIAQVKLLSEFLKTCEKGYNNHDHMRI